MDNIESIDGRPLFRLVFDADGYIDPVTSAALTEGIRASALTDLVIFSHDVHHPGGPADPGRPSSFVSQRGQHTGHRLAQVAWANPARSTEPY